MKKLLALLLLVSPLFTWAQDDLYFVPKKEKKVLVKKTVEEVYYVNDEDVVEEFVDTLDDATNEGKYQVSGPHIQLWHKRLVCL